MEVPSPAELDTAFRAVSAARPGALITLGDGMLWSVRTRIVEFAAKGEATFTGKFRRDLKDSDALHRGEGTVTVGLTTIGLVGELAPEPSYFGSFSWISRSTSSARSSRWAAEPWLASSDSASS